MLFHCAGLLLIDWVVLSKHPSLITHYVTFVLKHFILFLYCFQTSGFKSSACYHPRKFHFVAFSALELEVAFFHFFVVFLKSKICVL